MDEKAECTKNFCPHRHPLRTMARTRPENSAQLHGRQALEDSVPRQSFPHRPGETGFAVTHTSRTERRGSRGMPLLSRPKRARRQDGENWEENGGTLNFASIAGIGSRPVLEYMVGD